jgi:DNA polymerase (family 10)
LLRRPGYEIDIEPVLAACGEHGVAVEINSNPNRMELDWRWHQRALDLGCLLSINPDAHAIRELNLMRWGIALARKGGVPKQRVLNAMSLAQLRRHLKGRSTTSNNRGSTNVQRRR